MDTVALFTVFGWAFLSFWSAIPGGMALNLSPEITVLTAVASYGCGAALVVIAGEPLQKRLRQRMQNRRPNTPPQESAPAATGMLRVIHKAWNRFGLFGLAMLSPVTVGSLGGTLIGLSLGVRPLRLILMMTLGAGLWGSAIALAVRLGIVSIAGRV